MESTLRKLRGFDQTDGCRKAESLSQSERWRLYSRSLVTISAFDNAIHEYCRDYFDLCGNEDLNFRHKVCNQLKGPMSFAFLLTVHLDSPCVQSQQTEQSNFSLPVIRPTGLPPTPNTYTDLISEMRVQSLLEESTGGCVPAMRQQGRLIAKQAKEVELVQYLFIKRNKTEVFGTRRLTKFFEQWLPAHLDSN